MTLQDTLEQLNDIEGGDIERVIVRLWKRLEVDFNHDPAHQNGDFVRWSFSHVSRKILCIAVDQTLAPQVATIADECQRRLATTLEHLDVSLALLILLFGPTVVSSRACVQTLVASHRTCPDFQLLTLYDAYHAQPRQKGLRLVTDVFRFQTAAGTVDDCVPPKRRGSRTSKRTQGPNSLCAPSPRATSPESTAHQSLPELSRRAPAPASSNRPDSPNYFPPESDVESPKPPEVPPVVQLDILGHDLPVTPPVCHIRLSATPSGPPSNLSDNDDPLTFGDAFQHVDGPASDDGTDDDESQASFDGLAAPPADSSPRLPSYRHDALRLSRISEESGNHHFSEGNNSIHHHPEDTEAEAAVVSLSDNVSIRSRRKRTLEESAAESAGESLFLSPNPSDHASQGGVHKKAKTTIPANESPHSAPRRLDLERLPRALETLRNQNWLSDDVINTILCRLECPEIGVVSSLTLTSNQTTAGARFRLEQTITKPRVILPLYHGNHWTLLIWTRDQSLLEEYNSLPSTSAADACTGGNIVPDFLRWALDNQDLHITVRNMPCPRQPNHTDCGVYLLRFATDLMSGRNLPTRIDGEAERLGFMQRLLTSDHCTLEPRDAFAAATISYPARMENIIKRVVRARNFRALLDAAEEGSPTEPALRWAAHVEQLTERRDALRATISDLQKMHQETLLSTLELQKKAERAAERQDARENRASKTKEALESHAVFIAMDQDRSQLDARENRMRGYYDTIRKMLEMADAEDEPQAVEAERQEVAKSKGLIHPHYARCTALLVILRYAVKEHEATCDQISDSVNKRL